MSASDVVALSLFGDVTDEAPQSSEATDIAHLEDVAKTVVIRAFAWFQDEREMAWTFQLHEAANKIYGRNGAVPAHVTEYIRLASEAGSRAMSAAEYREDTDAELSDRINTWTAELASPPKKRRGKKAKHEVDEDEFDEEPVDEDLNRQILREWLNIALEERARRDRIPNFNHLLDIEQRAREKFGDEGLALIQRYVAQGLALADDELSAETDVLVNGKCLPHAYEAMKTLAKGDPTAAERFVDVLVRARIDQRAGYPEGLHVALAPRSAQTWTDEECRAFVSAVPGGIIVDGVALDLAEYDVFFNQFPVEYAITPGRPAQAWAQQFADALSSAGTDAQRALLEAMNFARIDVPIVVVARDNRWHIIDGKMRLASRFYSGLHEIPAVWIVQRRTHASGYQAQLLSGAYDDVDDDGDD